MSEFWSTILSLTPVDGTWQDVIGRIDSALAKQARMDTGLRMQRQPEPLSTRQLYCLSVDQNTRTIRRRAPIELSEAIGIEPSGIEFWRSASTEIAFDHASAFVDFSVRQAASNQTYVELWFPTKVYLTIFSRDMEQKAFNPAAKADLKRLFVNVSRAVGAAGFGYRPAGEDSLFGPVDLDALRDYVEIGGRWFQKRHELSLRMAGVAVSQVEEGLFEYDEQDQSRYHRQNGFYV
jgi:hypothetical protein